jgi:hypothetical protein
VPTNRPVFAFRAPEAWQRLRRFVIWRALRRANSVDQMSLGASDDDASDDLAGVHGPERVVDLLQRDAARHHRGEIEAARLDQ